MPMIHHYHGERNYQGSGNAFVFLDTTGEAPDRFTAALTAANPSDENLAESLFGLPGVGGQIGCEGRASAKHKQGFIQSNIRGVLIQKGMPNPLLIICIAVKFFECSLERLMFQHPGALKGVERRSESFACSRVNHARCGLDGMDAVGNRICILLRINVFSRLT